MDGHTKNQMAHKFQILEIDISILATSISNALLEICKCVAVY